ncbi:Transcription factor [Seminavis robusta]|uniref:Transcription factor n=1 Tax=Seminavis robusta TaxID=568900 RepID=A0A9N8HI25_9STRA|nr:Transcription factor [Seminavis robusta]|eukprot:Sro478_g150910.1 Transcription factor (351) ;mRNA; f:5575-6627
MNASQIETVYDCVVYQSSSGTLKLNEEHLSFHTDQKVSMLPWKKIVGRQVSSSHMKPMFKLVLKSGSEAIFQMQDRVSLEVVRDDLGERMSSWQTLHVVPPSTGSHEETVPAAFRTPRAQEHLKIPTSIRKGSGSEEVVNMTGNTVSERLSTPYRMVNPRVLSEVAPSKGKKQTKRRQSMPEQSTMKGKEANIKQTKERSQQRRASSMGPPQVSSASSKAEPTPTRKSSVNQQDAIKAVTGQLAPAQSKSKKQPKRRQSMPEQSTTKGKEATPKDGSPQRSASSMGPPRKPQRQGSSKKLDVSQETTGRSATPRATKKATASSNKTTRRRSRRSSAPDFTTKSMRRSNVV